MDGESGLNLALSENFDLIILDVMLPKKNGYDVCRDLRQRSINTPILMLTAKGEIFDKVLGLKLGADDYLTKPFEVIELLARIAALLRRSSSINQTSPDSFRFGTVAIDFKRAEILKNSQTVELSAMEFKLLQFLIENRGATRFWTKFGVMTQCLRRGRLMFISRGFGKNSKKIRVIRNLFKPFTGSAINLLIDFSKLCYASGHTNS